METPTEATVKEGGTSDLWDQIGFHKPMAGFWFNIVYTLIAILTSAILMGYLISFFYPFPESMGYKDVTNNIFGFLFMLFDIATGAVMARFLPEANIKDPRRMLHQIQYFIWYQMISGLIQTTLVSIYGIVFAPYSNIAYITWIILIVSTTQYPGFLGVFANVLDALQHYHKAQTSRFLASTVVQRFVEFFFVYLGQIYGNAHPEVGAIMGIAYGAAIGGYISQFTAMLVSAYFFTGIMKHYGIRPRDCFRIEFTWAEVKPMVIYAVKTSVPSIISGFLGYANLLLYIQFVPQYTTIVVFSTIGGSIGDTMDWFGSPNITSLVSESYMNGKKELTRYYVGQLFRFNALIHGFFFPLFFIVYLVMPVAWTALGMLNYMAGLVFILPRLIKTVINKYLGIPGQVLYGANRPNYGMVMGIIQSFLNTGMLSLYLIIWQIPKVFGLTGTALVMELGFLPLDIIFALIAYWYVHTRVVRLKIPFRQICIGIISAAGITLGVMLVTKYFVFDTLNAAFGFFVAVFPSVILLFLCLLFLYFPLTGILGGWDQTNLDEFRKVSKMSGPSKFVVKPIYGIVNRVCKRSKLHGRYAMPIEGVIQEAQELLAIKKAKREELKRELTK